MFIFLKMVLDKKKTKLKAQEIRNNTFNYLIHLAHQQKSESAQSIKDIPSYVKLKRSFGLTFLNVFSLNF